MKTLMKLSALALAVMLLCAFMVVPAAAAETKNAVVSIELAGERNVAGDPHPIEVGWGGAAITIGEKDIVVTAIGRMFFADGNISHGCLVTNEDGSLVASGFAIQGYDDSVDGTFEYYYFEKSEYITLEAGKTYYICTDFYGPLDKFYDSSTVTTTEDVSFVGKVDLNLADGSWIFTATTGIDYMPIDFKYYVAGEEGSTETEPPATEPSESKPAAPKPTTAPGGNNGNGAPAPSMDLGLIIGIAAAVVVVVVVVVVIVAKKKKA